MQDKFTFNFSRFFANMRRIPRSFGIVGQWYIQLQAFLMVLKTRAQAASWTYNQIWLETSIGVGLDAWGVRLETPRNVGEMDEAYRERLVIERAFRDGKADIQSKRKRLVQYIGNIEPEDLQIQSVYNMKISKESFRMGGVIDQQNFTRKYILFRYWLSLPELPDNQDRSKLVALIGQLNLGGNIPEFREDHGIIDFFSMGGTMGEPLASKRSEQSRNIKIY